MFSKLMPATKFLQQITSGESQFSSLTLQIPHWWRSPLTVGECWSVLEALSGPLISLRLICRSIFHLLKSTASEKDEKQSVLTFGDTHIRAQVDEYIDRWMTDHTSSARTRGWGPVCSVIKGGSVSIQILCVSKMLFTIKYTIFTSQVGRCWHLSKIWFV